VSRVEGRAKSEGIPERFRPRSCVLACGACCPAEGNYWIGIQGLLPLAIDCRRVAAGGGERVEGLGAFTLLLNVLGPALMPDMRMRLAERLQRTDRGDAAVRTPGKIIHGIALPGVNAGPRS
jgi:hypothetical protein